MRLAQESLDMWRRWPRRHYLGRGWGSPRTRRWSTGRSFSRHNMEAALRRLSESRVPLKRISRRCGLGSEATMRRRFLRLLAAAPQDYQARLGS